MNTQKPIALVTGATSGIGEACARRLHGAGYRVIITGRNTERLEALKTELGDDALTLTFDVRDREAAEAAIASLPSEWQEIEVLVNNAGLALGLEKEYEGDYRDWDT
ncbi:MAG: SDR family NAD(P)-dependent oxidoreductase, partial [Muribaculaceae bacterium]|nr:SDR family NAD(P)-dependent oxidoreductase [Muribaculaceae bacterium]